MTSITLSMADPSLDARSDVREWLDMVTLKLNEAIREANLDIITIGSTTQRLTMNPPVPMPSKLHALWARRDGEWHMVEIGLPGELMGRIVRTINRLQGMAPKMELWPLGQAPKEA